jgi:hypothetical protein
MAKTRSGFDLADHFGQERHPVDAAVERDPKVRALRRKVRQLSRTFTKALGPRLAVWLPLESALVELATTREERMFDQGHAHGYAAGRAEGMASTPKARALAAVLRDHAIQAGCPRETALAALLEAAWALVVNAKPARTQRSRS